MKSLIEFLLEISFPPFKKNPSPLMGKVGVGVKKLFMCIVHLRER